MKAGVGMASNQYNNISYLYNLSTEKINEIVIDVRSTLEDIQLTIATLEKVAEEKEAELEEVQEFLESGLYIPGAQINPELVQELDAINERIDLNRQKFLYCINILENMITLKQTKIEHKYGLKITMDANDFAEELDTYVSNLEKDTQTNKIGFIK